MKTEESSVSELRTNDKVHEALLTKIKSKMDVSKFFAGFFTVFVAMSSKDLAEAVTGDDQAKKIAGWIAVLSSLASLCLTFSALSSFDSLLMPPDLWVKRHRYSTNHLKVEMMKVWNFLYGPAVWALLIAIVAFFYAISGSNHMLLAGVAIIVLVPVLTAFVTRNQGVFR